MVKRILGIFHKEISGLHQAAYLLGFFALCSQILALVRDRILAAHFGATNTLDIYYAAFRIPDFLFASVGSLVSASILLPYFIERFGKGRHDVKTQDKGTGLGLAIVKGFAEAHDGSVELRSDLGTGTRVTVTFPAERAIQKYNARAAG